MIKYPEIAPISELPHSVILQLERVQNNIADEAERMRFIADITENLLVDDHGKVIGFDRICQHLLVHETSFLHWDLTSAILTHFSNNVQLKTLCEQYSETSGLALYLLTYFDPKYKDDEEKYKTLLKAATLKSANAMQRLYFEFFCSSFSLFNRKPVIPSREEAWQFLLQAAELGSAKASVVLYQSYIGNLQMGKKVDLKKALNCLLKALPSSNGLVEYELSLLLEYGLQMEDGQMIPADPERAAKYLKIAFKNSSEDFIKNRVKKFENFRQQQTLVPEEIRQALHRIKVKTERPGDSKILLHYIKNIEKYDDLHNLLALLITQHILYLPPKIFTALSSLTSSINDVPRIENIFKDCSPLIESLFYPKSILPAQRNSPHAEFVAYSLYAAGGEATYEMIGGLNTGTLTVVPDEKLKRQFLQRAAENGHRNAQYHLGMQLLPNKRALGMQWLTKAAEQYHLHAIVAVADGHWSRFEFDNHRNFKSGTTAIYYYSLAQEFSGDIAAEYERKKNELAVAAKTVMTSKTKKSDPTFFSSTPTTMDVRYGDLEEIDENSALLDHRISPTCRWYETKY